MIGHGKAGQGDVEAGCESRILGAWRDLVRDGMEARKNLVGAKAMASAFEIAGVAIRHAGPIPRPDDPA